MRIPGEEQWRRARDRLQNVIGTTGVARGIADETVWRNGFMEELRILSRLEAEELGPGPEIDKGTYRIRAEQWVHARVLFTILDLVAWMGPEWSNHFPDVGREDQFIELVRRAFRSNIRP